MKLQNVEILECQFYIVQGYIQGSIATEKVETKGWEMSPKDGRGKKNLYSMLDI